MYVDDLADACIYFMKKRFKETTINVGTGKDYSINYLAKLVLKTIIPNRNIKIRYDLSKPNGTPRKVLDIKLKRLWLDSKIKFKRINFKNLVKILYKKKLDEKHNCYNRGCF